jgi:cytochrome c-type biogenesis protein CcmH/NrfF
LRISAATGKSATIKNVGVGDFVREKIFEGLSNNEIVDACKEKYGNEQTSYNCVVWYRNKMKKEGLV